jgi:hypothetical protein
MPTPVAEQRAALLRNLHRGFDLTEAEASTLAEALKRGGPLANVMHVEIMVGHSRLKSPHATLAAAVRAYMLSRGVATNLVELVAGKIRPNFKYIYYILRDGSTYGGFALSETPI